MGRSDEEVVPDIIFKYYSTLGIRPNAYVSHETVRKAYKAKAKEIHPDKNSDSDATVKFQRLSEAYVEVLHFLSSSVKNKKIDSWEVLLLGLIIKPSVGNENIAARSIPKKFSR